MKAWELVAFVLLVRSSIITSVVSKPQVPCFFIFGDSLSDVGNNNDLNTLAKANYAPYGIDFSGGVATGRFSNGRNCVDRITELLGFDEYIPPYTTANGEKILNGVNYASGGAGIRSETSQHLGERVSMDQQLVHHLSTVAKMTLMLGFSVTERLNKCLYTVNIGSNDYINNYFMPEYYSSSKQYNPKEYAEVLVKEYFRQLKSLYLAGARKVAVFGLGLIGCTLAEISMHGTNGSLCVDSMNEATQLFNDKLVSLVDEFNSDLPGAQFTYIGSSVSTDTGSAVANATCCEVREDYQCKNLSSVCQDRNNYIFWDGFHPTEVVDIFTAEAAYDAGSSSNSVHPVDIKTLVSADQEYYITKPTSGSANRYLLV